jgi:imidazolonepropionase-like amidohydrolase
LAELLIEAERIVPGDLTTIAAGYVLVRDGVIAAVGEGPPRADRTCG